jgi:hypothetical protein
VAYYRDKQKYDAEAALDYARDEGLKQGLEMAEAKYQPVIEEKDQALMEKDRENQDLRRILREAGIEPPEN